jgi:hypothetical protein
VDFLRALTVLVALSLFGCAKGLPLPEMGPHVSEAPVVVPYPPPPARVEIVTPRPSVRDVWVDGEWLWRGRRWVWQRGEWTVPPPNSYYAPPVTLRQPDGTLTYFRGGWREKRTAK